MTKRPRSSGQAAWQGHRQCLRASGAESPAVTAPRAWSPRAQDDACGAPPPTPDGPRRGAAARFDCRAISTAVLGGIFVSTFKELRVVLSDGSDYCRPRPCHPAPASLGPVWLPVSPRPPTRPESPQRARRPAHGTDGFLKLHRIKKKVTYMPSVVSPFKI